MGADNSVHLSYYINRAMSSPNFAETENGKQQRMNLFAQMDADSSGQIDKKESIKMWKCFNAALKKVRAERNLDAEKCVIKKDKFLAMVETCDKEGNSDGQMDFEEFSSLLAKIIASLN